MILIFPAWLWPTQLQACKLQVFKHVQSTTVNANLESANSNLAELTRPPVGNEQELNRGSISSNIGDRTNHEVTSW
jgi:hypothetical protein